MKTDKIKNKNLSLYAHLLAIAKALHWSRYKKLKNNKKTRDEINKTDHREWPDIPVYTRQSRISALCPLSRRISKSHCFVPVLHKVSPGRPVNKPGNRAFRLNLVVFAPCVYQLQSCLSDLKIWTSCTEGPLPNLCVKYSERVTVSGRDVQQSFHQDDADVALFHFYRSANKSQNSEQTGIPAK